jgi:transposase-like protein
MPIAETSKPTLSPAELARRWDVSEKTLANWRSLGRGPKAVKIGRSIRYPLEEVERVERQGTRP